ncbi:MAG: hypothetical protein WBA57_06985 [Elainellaceae cyanobacterium]
MWINRYLVNRYLNIELEDGEHALGAIATMGFISKIFGAIFGFIGGLFSSIGKVFGLGGKSDYFVELDDSNAASAPPAKPASAAPVEAKQSVKAESSPAAAEPQAKAAPAPAAPAPQPAAASASHANGSASMNNGKVIPGLTFAPDAMLTASTSGGRRRPGPSLSPFKEMARNMQR